VAGVESVRASLVRVFPKLRARRSVHLVAFAVMVAALAAYFSTPRFLDILEAKLYDLHFALRGPQEAGDRIVVLAIDERSLATIGRWPWRRSVLAEVVERLSAAGARVIALDVLLSEPEVSGELRAARRLDERLGALRLRDTPTGRVFAGEVARLLEDADADARLEAAIRRSGRVILPVTFELVPEHDRLPSDAPEPSGPAYRSALMAFRHYEERGLYPPPRARSVTPPIPTLAAAARELGHVTMLADQDGSTRWEAVVIELGGRYYPSLGVQAVRVALGVDPSAFRLDFGRSLEVGDIVAPVDVRDRSLLNYAGGAGTFPHISAVDLLQGRVAPESIRDRLVFVGATALATYDLRVTPVSPVFPGVEKHANVAGNLLSGQFLRRPGWVALVEASGVILVPFVLAWVLPRLRPVAGISFGALLLVLLFAASHVAFRLGVWVPILYPLLTVFAGLVTVTGFLYVTEERKRLGIKRAFQRFVSPDVVERIADDPGALQFGGEARPLTVLFADIRDFTGYTERHSPQELVQILREYFTRMVEQIQASQGTLDKFIGDAVMAIFGAPLAYPDHAERACRVALAMLAELEKLRAKWVEEGREPFRIGIGINTGEMVVGNLGSEQVFTYTAVGDGVNLASRLESLTKEFAVPVIISEATYEAVRHVFHGRFLGEVRVKGKSVPAKIYALEREPVARSRRVALTGQVTVLDGDVAVPAAVENLSLSGMAVHDLARDLPAARVVQLRLRPLGVELEVALEARVVWTQPGRAGFTFMEPPAEARRALEALVGPGATDSQDGRSTAAEEVPAGRGT
jgi:adenylate cyclase